MDFLPIFLNVKDQLCLVVGGGAVPAQGVYAGSAGQGENSCAGAFRRFCRYAGIEHVAEYFQPAHLEGAALAIAATGDSAVNRDVSQQAQARNIR